MRHHSTPMIRHAAVVCAGAFAAILLLAGCGKAPAAQNESVKTGVKKTSTTPPPQQTAAKTAAAPKTAFLSVFSTDNPRDPFHPQIKPKAAATPVIAGVPSDIEAPQLIAAVQNGFQGILASTDERELLVYGVLLRENQQATITVSLKGQQRKLKVKALKIYRNAAQLQVEGLPQPVTLPKAQ